MKSTVVNTKPVVEEVQAPCLMILKKQYRVNPADTLIVLASKIYGSTFRGTVVHLDYKTDTSGRRLGEFCDGWDTGQFEQFRGHVILDGE